MGHGLTSWNGWRPGRTRLRVQPLVAGRERLPMSTCAAPGCREDIEGDQRNASPQETSKGIEKYIIGVNGTAGCHNPLSGLDSDTEDKAGERCPGQVGSCGRRKG
jgi:hypothetical protein